MKFYFDINDGDEIYPDDTGQELGDIEAARRVAVAMLPGLSVPLLDGQDRHEVAVHVRDESLEWIFTARISTTVEDRPATASATKRLAGSTVVADSCSQS